MSCMKKTEVYSWRVEAHLKADLEAAAREAHCSLGSLLGRIAQDWLHGGHRLSRDEDAAQNRIREEAGKYLGSVCGGDPLRAEQASARVKQILKEKHARSRTD